jgi:hypothetical protein
MAAVSPKELRQLVNRLEAEAASGPWLYKLRVVALALLGYAYLLLILAFSAYPFCSFSGSSPARRPCSFSSS